MILNVAADLAQIVSMNYKHSSVGSGQKLLLINLKFFIGKMQKVLT
jgi:hypothetical protein